MSTNNRQLWNEATTAASMSTDQMPTVDEIIDIMKQAKVAEKEYRRKRDEAFAKITCLQCDCLISDCKPIKALDRGMGEEWEVCGHMLDAIKATVPTASHDTRPWMPTLHGVALVLRQDEP